MTTYTVTWHQQALDELTDKAVAGVQERAIAPGGEAVGVVILP